MTKRSRRSRSTKKREREIYFLPRNAFINNATPKTNAAGFHIPTKFWVSVRAESRSKVRAAGVGKDLGSSVVRVDVGVLGVEVRGEEEEGELWERARGRIGVIVCIIEGVVTVEGMVLLRGWELMGWFDVKRTFLGEEADSLSVSMEGATARSVVMVEL